MSSRFGIALVLVLTLVACRTNPAAPSSVAAPPPPAFLGVAPYTWEQLNILEAWLDGPGPRGYPDASIEAELALAEGRLHFAKRDRGSSPPATIARRIAAADAGFRRVISAEDASALARHRARRGLEETRGLREAGAPTGDLGMAVRTRSSWGARTALPALLTPQRSAYTRITVHHSAPPSALPTAAATEVFTDEIRRLQRYHMDQVQPRCGDIGYHFLIDPNGTVYEGRSLNWQGAHAGGANNVNNIGVCVLGDFRDSPPTPKALGALEQLLNDLRARHRIARDSVHIKGHKELKATECPGDALMRWVERYRG